MLKKLMVWMLGCGFIAAAGLVQAGPITIDCQSKKVVIVTDADGKETETLESMSTVLPGEVIEYSLVCANSGTEAAEKLVIGNPLPKEVLYLEGSATTAGAALRFSVDGGKTFGAAESLRVQDEKVGERPAVAADYTHLQWILSEPLKPGTTKTVTYRVRLK